jgi:hypothetical protein
MSLIGKGVIREEFDWGFVRKGTIWPKTYDTTLTKNDMIENSINGRWEGWVFASVMTYR